jgi:cation diffusion facilitator family transporter
MLLTTIMMAIEIVAGMVFGSMALLADGWHMATHVAAFGVVLFVYCYARINADNPRFTFGTGKVSVLGGFASAIALTVVALFMALESVMRVFAPRTIHSNEALAIAVVGLLVNLASGFLLQGRHSQEHEQGHHHHDHNLRAAYLHVLADALTSVLAIMALLSGKYFGWVWLDPMMGLAGAGVITWWSYSLLRGTGYILLDGTADEHLRSTIRDAIEQDADNRIADLHIWQVGAGHFAAVLSIVTHHPRAPEHYNRLIGGIPHLEHVLIEVNQCHGKPAWKR